MGLPLPKRGVRDDLEEGEDGDPHKSDRVSCVKGLAQARQGGEAVEFRRFSWGRRLSPVERGWGRWKGRKGCAGVGLHARLEELVDARHESSYPVCGYRMNISLSSGARRVICGLGVSTESQ
ncbi:unnamed protein product, partial [Clonostachys rosea f. rosea IK726]